MFEDAMMESGGRIKTKSKYFIWVGIVLNGAIIATMILIPLIYPEALPSAALTTLLVAPPPPPPPPRHRHRQLRRMWCAWFRRSSITS